MGRWRASLGAKLFLSYLLVILVGIATLFGAATTVAPAFFARHLAAMTGDATPPLDEHLRAAFNAALLQALAIAASAATLAAILVSVFVSRQITRPVRRMLAATRRIAAGHYSERVPPDPATAGDELGHLADSFNVMAEALEQTERRRLALIGDVAHELRTPIATLEGYLEGLLDDVIAPSPRTWAMLHDEAGRLRRLVDDLQELSRAEARQLALVIQPTSPAAIVQATLDRLEPLFQEKGLVLCSSVPAGLPAIQADQDRAVQVLTNLLTNALRYTPAPGQVTVAADRTGDAITFRVTDTGIGFEPAQAAQLFERFYRADKSRSRSLGGSGIGLTIARALVEAMGGRIWAESAGPGQGSTFAFTFPLVR